MINPTKCEFLMNTLVATLKSQSFQSLKPKAKKEHLEVTMGFIMPQLDYCTDAFLDAAYEGRIIVPRSGLTGVNFKSNRGLTKDALCCILIAKCSLKLLGLDRKRLPNEDYLVRLIHHIYEGVHPVLEEFAIATPCDENISLLTLGTIKCKSKVEPSALVQRFNAMGDFWQKAFSVIETSGNIKMLLEKQKGAITTDFTKTIRADKA